MADTIEEIAIGNTTSLVAADLTIDFTNPSVTGTLSTLVNGIQVPVTALTLSTVNGVTTVSGTTLAGTGVSVNFNGTNPIAANATVSALGLPPVTVQEAAAVVCYASGTHIRTDRGDVAVESLQVGDIAVTAFGERRAIRWIGHRAYAGRFANANPDLLPVCVKAGAIADNVPSRDLWVSPKHALYIDGVLIPAASLVDGHSVIKAEHVDALEYWHVELDSHDVLLAENTPAESFVDDCGRGIFLNAETYRALYPDAVEIEATYCAPRVESGHVVAAVRRRLAERAGLAAAPAALFGQLHGHLDVCDGAVVKGWAWDELHSNAPVCLDVVVDGVLVAMTYADRHRADLEHAGIGDGCHGFLVALPLAPDEPHEVVIRRSADQIELGGSPWHLAAVSTRAA